MDFCALDGLGILKEEGRGERKRRGGRARGEERGGGEERGEVRSGDVRVGHWGPRNVDRREG